MILVITRAMGDAYKRPMNQTESNSDYCRRRAAEEREAAAQAKDERAARAHRDLAEHFEGLSRQAGGAASVDRAPTSILAGEFRIIP